MDGVPYFNAGSSNSERVSLGILYGRSTYGRFQQQLWLDPQRVCQPPQCTHRRVPGAAFEIAHVAAFHTRIERKPLLRHTLQLPMMAHVRAEKLHHIHARM